MVTIYYTKTPNKIIADINLNLLADLDYDDILWIDLNNPDGNEKRTVEEFLGTELQGRAQAEEIESSSRYFETEDSVFANSNFLISHGDSYSKEPLSFIITQGILITVRNVDLRTLNEIARKIQKNPLLAPTGYHLMTNIIEMRIDLDADMVEGIAKEISQLNKLVSLGNKVDEDTVYYLNQLQENTMIIRENIVDKQRVISSILRSDKFPSDLYTKLNLMIKDINSLTNHTDFSFERLDFLQDTILGLINLEQNKITKVFTIVSVLFMPPTLIASIYGMNFEFIPALDWDYGYLFAFIMMVLASAIIVIVFRKKKWL